MPETDTRRVVRPPQPPGDLRASVNPSHALDEIECEAEDAVQGAPYADAPYTGAPPQAPRGGWAGRVVLVVVLAVIAVAIYFIFR